MVGRTVERVLLERHLLGDGSPVLLLAGEPGIGKTRLLEETMQRAHGLGWRVLWGGCRRQGREEPYAPVLDVLMHALQRMAPAEQVVALRGCAWLGRLLPDLAGDGNLAEAMALPPQGTLSAADERRLIVESVGRFLANVSAQRGTLLLLDDLQWIGTEALSLLVSLVRGGASTVGASPLRIVGAYRDTELPAGHTLASAWAELAQAGLVTHHMLAPLAPAETRTLLEALLPVEVKPTDAAWIERLAERTGGVPYFVVNFAQKRADERRLAAFTTDKLEEVEAVPWTVRQSVEQRITMLTDASRGVLNAVAVGRVVSVTQLARITGQPEDVVVDALDAATRLRLLEDDQEGGYRFSYDVIREVVEADLTSARRVLLHRQLAAMEQVREEPPGGEVDSSSKVEISTLNELLPADPRTPRTNLPTPLAGFVGREVELALIAERLADPACRLLTLSGLGGCGKTRLALHAAAAQAEPAPLGDQHPFADGVYLVDLAAISAPQTRSVEGAAVAMQRIAVAIGGVVALVFQGVDPVADLAGWLRTRAVLLVLDNMEHLLEGAALLSLLLERSLLAKILVTTRERLRLPGEWVVEVEGLALPEEPADLEQAPASSFYLQLMRQAGAPAPPDVAERAAIVRLCGLTHGLPLALALAARWTPSLTTAAIVRELETGLDLLATDEQHVPERQRSMLAVLQWTWDRLSNEGCTAMRRLAVFQPGFTREAAREVAGVELASLLKLCEGALLSRDPTTGRYRMHELVRQYAAEQLVAHPAEETDMRGRQAAFYAVLVQQVTPALRESVTAQEAIGADIANIRVAWDWAAERADVGLLERMLVGVPRWTELQGLPGRAAEALERVAGRLRATLAQAATPDPSAQRLLGFVLTQQAFDLSMLSAYDRAVHLLEEARELARVTASLHLEARVAYGLGHQLSRQHDLRGAQHWLQQALLLARSAQEPSLEADTLAALGQATMETGEYARARDYFERALPICRAQHDRYREQGIMYCLGMMAHARGDFDSAKWLLEDALQLVHVLGCRNLSEHYLLHALGDVYDEGWGRHLEAEDCFVQSLRLPREIGDRTREGFALAALGRNALYQGDLERATALLDQALSLSRQIGGLASTAMALRGQSLLAHYQGDDRRARQCAEEALAIAGAAAMRPEERQALRLLGHALLGLGDRQAALAAYQRVVDLDNALGITHHRRETATDLAQIALVQGSIAQAMAHVDGILVDLENGAAAGLEEPVLAYLICYRILRAAGDARADGVLAAGSAFLGERAAQFADEVRRARFLGNVPAHRELLVEWQARMAGERVGGEGALA
jgi:predicted ATPase